jgi:hypothetical protein
MGHGPLSVTSDEILDISEAMLQINRNIRLEVVVFWILMWYHITTRRHKPEDHDLKFTAVQMSNIEIKDLFFIFIWIAG